MSRRIVRGFMWSCIAMNGVFFCYWTACYFAATDAAREAHCVRALNDNKLSAVTAMVLFLCVPKSPLYLAPDDERKDGAK